LREIGKDRIEITLLTFEPELKTAWTTEEIDAVRQRLREEGIEWEYLPYHKRPSALATAWDIFRGAIRVWRLNKKKFDVLHCRVHVPAVMAAIARKFGRNKPKILFDIRGFFPEEFVDAGVWPENGALFRTAKRVERWLMDQSDGFVVLTESAREILFPESRETGLDRYGRPVEVIPCCVDLTSRFPEGRSTSRDSLRNRLGIDDRYVITHVGALGGLYLSGEIAHFVGVAKNVRPETYAIFLTQSDPERIVQLLRKHGLTENDYLVIRVPASQVPEYLEASDLGLSFVKATFATQSRSPTKIPEYLAAGLPIIANAGVGDVDRLIKANPVGTLIDEFSERSYRAALNEVRDMAGNGVSCRETAKREFDLERIGGRRYRSLYRRLVK
jgi:glycosyltransferase involved in cell wall biosynthesis